MKRLIYQSDARPDLEADDIFAIIQQSSAWNGSVGLHGFLLLKGGRFMQLLEGNGRALDELFAKVRTDPRHRNVDVVFEGPIDSCCFTQWRMKRIPADDADAARTALRTQQDQPLPPREAAIIERFLGARADQRATGVAA